MTKQELREQIKAKIAKMKAADKDTASLYVCLQIIGTEEWQKAETVLLYSAMPDEVDLSLLIQDAEGSDKTIILPVVDGENLLLRVYDSCHMARQGKYQILEPTVQCKLFTQLSDIDLAIIPGRAFTAQGERMGRGKGYYDRTLSALKCPKWGVAFHCQMVKEIPTDPWDVRLEKVFEN